tara:strand:- start:313 stop:540 length:228 start_codon:yes stop_codon:yes gene_type:complete
MIGAKEICVSTATVVGVGFLSWMAITLISVDKRTAVMSFKVSQNHDMLKPLWEEFIKQKVKKEQVTNEKASIVWR